MKRKRFVKLMMAAGVGRNAANCLCKHRHVVMARDMAMIMSAPSVKCITNVAMTKGGWTFSVKCAD